MNDRHLVYIHSYKLLLLFKCDDNFIWDLALSNIRSNFLPSPDNTTFIFLFPRRDIMTRQKKKYMVLFDNKYMLHQLGLSSGRQSGSAHCLISTSVLQQTHLACRPRKNIRWAFDNKFQYQKDNCSILSPG